MGREELLFEGTAAALGNGLRSSGKGTHTSQQLRAHTPWSSFLTPCISLRKRLGGAERFHGMYTVLHGVGI